MIHENNEVFIKDLDTKKCAFFTPPRWKRFVGLIDDIKEQVWLAKVDITTNYLQHIGGMWHFSSFASAALTSATSTTV